MENLIETLKNTVAFFMALRIAILIGLVFILARITYTLLTSAETKRFWHERGRAFPWFKKLFKSQQ